MQRLNSVNPQVAQGRSKELLDTVQQAFGVVPNTAKVMANSPAVLESFLAFSTAMRGAKIGTKLHNQVKLTTSETNSCDYCTSILSAVAPSAACPPPTFLQVARATPKTIAPRQLWRLPTTCWKAGASQQTATRRRAGGRLRRCRNRGDRRQRGAGLLHQLSQQRGRHGTRHSEGRANRNLLDLDLRHGNLLGALTRT